MTWYTRGYENIPKPSGGRLFYNRVYLKYGESRDVIFVDDDPFRIWEHNWRGENKWKNWCTCKGDGCQSCAAKMKRYFIGYYTVVDTSEWTDKKGVKHQFEMSFLCAKSTSLATIGAEVDLSNDPQIGRDGLKGSMYRLKRSTKEVNEKAPGIGDAMGFMRVGNMEKLFESAMFKGQLLTQWFDDADEDAEKLEALQNIFVVEKGENGKLIRKVPIFNYDAILTPLSDKDMKAKVSGVVPEGDDNYNLGNQGNQQGGDHHGGGGFSQADEDMPF